MDDSRCGGGFFGGCEWIIIIILIVLIFCPGIFGGFGGFGCCKD